MEDASDTNQSTKRPRTDQPSNGNDSSPPELKTIIKRLSESAKPADAFKSKMLSFKTKNRGNLIESALHEGLADPVDRLIAALPRQLTVYLQKKEKEARLRDGDKDLSSTRINLKLTANEKTKKYLSDEFGAAESEIEKLIREFRVKAKEQIVIVASLETRTSLAELLKEIFDFANLLAGTYVFIAESNCGNEIAMRVGASAAFKVYSQYNRQGETFLDNVLKRLDVTKDDVLNIFISDEFTGGRPDESSRCEVQRRLEENEDLMKKIAIKLRYFYQLVGSAFHAYSEKEAQKILKKRAIQFSTQVTVRSAADGMAMEFENTNTNENVNNTMGELKNENDKLRNEMSQMNEVWERRFKELTSSSSSTAPKNEERGAPPSKDTERASRKKKNKEKKNRGKNGKGDSAAGNGNGSANGNGKPKKSGKNKKKKGGN